MGKRNNIHIELTSKTAKVRSPWLVLLFTILTVGIYSCFWWYFINRELSDLGRSRGTDELGTEPALSTLAYTIGGFIYIPVIWTIFTTNGRVLRAQRLTVGQSMNGWLAAAFWVLTLGIGGMVYLQHELNKVWRAPGMRPVQAPEEDSGGQGDAERLSKLDELKAADALDEREYEREKQRLGL